MKIDDVEIIDSAIDDIEEDTIRRMLRQIYLMGNVHAKDRMTAKDIHDRLKEFADNSELEQDEVPKISTIQE
ncbi:30500_t:CDS:2 [Racocetra persica]|uniref:30500_t:CDS:1 n=1 Tax=Racocetra persica TaxID=160502 RepID=A0ACA9Q1B1_9GLOM|nr:30500_t:CDS:2 [Racocetra persica]